MKSKNLYELISLGLSVPKFECIDAKTLKENTDDSGKISPSKLKELVRQIDTSLGCKFYAVRSNALIEDSQSESFAGQFQTEVNVKSEDMAAAIARIVSHAFKFLSGSIEKFSIIVQQYIEADIAGVCFTRNPKGGREMLIEYHHGIGEDLVGGRVKPEKDIENLPNFEQASENFKKIEKHFDFPQDIEWCIKNDEWFFLQTRPITSITKDEWEQSLYLDSNLPKGKFYFEKTEISEIAPRPTEITNGILERIYGKNGPIDQVYKKYKIKYESQNLLKIIGNELFVDREAELKSLLPSYSFFGSKNLRPGLSKLSGIWTTVWNIFFLHRIKLSEFKQIFENLKKSIESIEKETDFEQFLGSFLLDYQIVFEINLLTGIAMKRAETILKKEISMALLLSQGAGLLDKENNFHLKVNAENLIGNSLEISDETQFVRNILENTKEKTPINEWWNKLSEIKKTIFHEKIQQIIVYNRLREMSRWLVVKKINHLRKILFDLAEKNNFWEKKDVYFAEIKEICDGKISEAACKKKAAEYLKYMKFYMPKILAYKSVYSGAVTQGVSSGIASGILVNEAEISTHEHKDHDKILYTKILSPDLVKHFESIKGIVSEQGGMLSHLAIIARERQLPIVIGFEIGKIKIGDKISINGDTGEARRFDKISESGIITT